MIELATKQEHLAGANYIVTINCRDQYSADTPDEAWRIIGEQPFGAGHIVTSPVGLNVSEFIPF